MKKMVYGIFCLLFAWTAQAAFLLDNFENYSTGPVTVPWVITDGSPAIGQETGGNQYQESYGSYLPLDSYSIDAADTETTVFFRIYKPAGTSPDCSVGLSDISDAQGDWNDFEAYIVVVGGGLSARNGSSNVPIVSPMTEAAWYNIWMVLNNSANTYDIYVTTGSSDADAGDRVADDFAFRKSTANDLVTFKVYGRAAGYGPVRIDDIFISGGTDLTIPSDSSNPPPVIITNPTNVTVNELQDAVFQTVFTSESLPSADWYKAALPSDLFMDPAQSNVDVQLSYDAQTEQYTSTFTLTGVMTSDSGQYYCRVNNESNYPRNSDTAALIVCGPVAHWTLDQDSFVGGYYLEEVSGYDAAVSGTPTFVTGADGIASHAVQISAADGWALCPPLSPTSQSGQMTVSFWANWSQSSPTRQDLLAESTNAEQLVMPNGLKADGQWQHICTVFDGTAGKLYVDGLLQDQGPWLTPAETDANINIGAGADGQNPFNGAIDDMRLYNYALTDTDVADLYYELSGQSVCLPAYIGPFDLTGPDSQPDCIVDLYDLAAFTGQWMILYDFEDFAGFTEYWMSNTLYPN